MNLQDGSRFACRRVCLGEITPGRNSERLRSHASGHGEIEYLVLDRLIGLKEMIEPYSTCILLGCPLGRCRTESSHEPDSETP